MKNHYLLSCCVAWAFLLCAQFAYGQHDADNMEFDERFNTLRIALITEKLNLSSEQAEKFWPIFNDFSRERKEIKKKLRNLDKKFEVMNDDEVKKSVDLMFELRQKELDLEKNYHLKFQKVISIRQIAELFRAEMHFKKKLMEQLKKRREKE